MLWRMLFAILLLVGGCRDHRYGSVYGVNYGGGVDPAQTMDVHEPRPRGEGGRPAIVAIHGGAWQGGDKTDWGREVAARYCPRGYVVFSINYRLAPVHRWPTQLHDCQDALRYVQEHATSLGVDQAKVGVFGVSAGGHLAAMLATHPGTKGLVTCAVTASGESDLTVRGVAPIMANEDSILTTLFGPVFTERQLADASPVRLAATNGCPMWVVHSRDDNNVYFSQGERLARRLQVLGIPGGFTALDDGGHSDCWQTTQALNDTRAFFARYLGGER